MNFPTLDFFVFFALLVTSLALLKPWISYRCILLIGSWAFYASWNPMFLLLLVGSTLVDFFVGQKLSQEKEPVKRKFWLSLSLVFNIGALCFFKYALFFIHTFDDIFQLNLPHLEIVLPMGISFYTFQTLSYTLDIYFNRQKRHPSFIDFALYVAFFPQLVAGPIVRASHFLPQIKKHLVFTAENTTWAFQRFVWGLSKKLLIADQLGSVVDSIYRHPEHFSGHHLTAATLFFTIQLYVDFSAYSDMAIALTRFFGFKIPENFNNPFFAKNISEFWQRWHISLSSWLKDYLYIPLGGSRKSLFITYRNLLITMILGGLWHGASWGFILWGLFHGLLLIGYRLVPKFSFPLFFSRLITFVCVCFGFVFFRAETVSDAGIILQRIGLYFLGQNSPAIYWVPLVPSSLLAIVVFIGCCAFHLNYHRLWGKIPASLQAVVVAILLWTSLALAPSTHRAFYYFIF